MLYAGLCAVLKDEDAILHEWLAYHLRVGFEHIWLYDNESRTPVAETAREFVSRGLVTVLSTTGRRQQLAAYRDCLTTWGAQTAWMGFIDLDEYVVPTCVDDVRDLLERYEGFGGLGLHWRMFGSGGLVQHPVAGVARSFTRVVERNSHIKSFVRPQAVAQTASPHHFIYHPGKFCVNEDGIPIQGSKSYHVSKLAQINHYYFRSKEDFEAKISRPMATGPKDGSCKRNVPGEWAAFRAQELRSTAADCETDTAILRLLPGKSVAQDVALQLSAPVLGTFAEYSHAISEAVSIGNTTRAAHLLRCCLRRCPEPAAQLMAARLCFLLNDRETCFRCLRELLGDPANPLRKPALAMLEEAYTRFGEPETARALHSILY